MKRTKRIFAVLFCLAAVFAMTACGSSSSKSNDPGNGNDPDKVYKIGICQLAPHPALDAATEGFKACLEEKLGKDKVKFNEQNAAGDAPTCTTIIDSLIADNSDLILANATAALQAAYSGTKDIPILGTSITDYASALDISDWTGTTGINVSGTSDLAPLAEQAAIIKELFPDAKKVGLIYCSAEPNSKYQVDIVNEELTKLGYECKYFSFTDSNDIQSVTEGAVGESDVIYIPTDNTAANSTGVIDNVCRPAGVPIVAGEEGICGGCGVATLSISYYDIGYKAGEMAYDILVNGADITKMEIQYAPKAVKKYNKEICDELDIKVPDDYEEIVVEE